MPFFSDKRENFRAFSRSGESEDNRKTTHLYRAFATVTSLNWIKIGRVGATFCYTYLKQLIIAVFKNACGELASYVRKFRRRAT